MFENPFFRWCKNANLFHLRLKNILFVSHFLTFSEIWNFKRPLCATSISLSFIFIFWDLNVAAIFILCLREKGKYFFVLLIVGSRVLESNFVLLPLCVNYFSIVHAFTFCQRKLSKDNYIYVLNIANIFKILFFLYLYT